MPAVAALTLAFAACDSDTPAARESDSASKSTISEKADEVVGQTMGVTISYARADDLTWEKLGELELDEKVDVDDIGMALIKRVIIADASKMVDRLIDESVVLNEPSDDHSVPLVINNYGSVARQQFFGASLGAVLEKVDSEQVAHVMIEMKIDPTLPQLEKEPSKPVRVNLAEGAGPAPVAARPPAKRIFGGKAPDEEWLDMKFPAVSGIRLTGRDLFEGVWFKIQMVDGKEQVTRVKQN